MRTTWKAIHVVKEHVKKEARSGFQPAHLSRPSTIPRKPLRPNIFRLPVGQKEIYLPNFVVALIRPSRHLPANYASFMVPLWFSKLDLKDYLYNLYNVEVLSVRSYVIQSRPRERGFQGSQRWYRPASTKKMTAEMTKNGDPALAAFEWPAVPEDLSPWGSQRTDDGIWRNTVERRHQALKEQNEMLIGKEDEKPPEDSEEVRRLAARKRREAKEQETAARGEKRTGRKEEEKSKSGKRVKLREIG